MKLLKYVMTDDTGLAPNPFHGFCSLALCTPNHGNAKLEVGDWIVGHSTKATGWKLIHAMRVTRILTMQKYFEEYPEKHPDPHGSREQQSGDNFYFLKDDRWKRLPSAEHNNVELFQRDQGRRVFLSESKDDYWYFGALDDLFTRGFGFDDDFSGLVQRHRHFSYVRDEALIQKFVKELENYGQSGKIGDPRDRPSALPGQFLVEIDPGEKWISADGNSPVPGGNAANRGCGRRARKTPAPPACGKPKRGCR